MTEYKEFAVVADEITNTIHNLNSLTQSNAASAMEIAANSGEINEIALKLTGRVGFFKID